MTSPRPDPRELPEAVRAQLDAASRADPPTDLLDAVVTEVGRTPQARTWWRVPRVAVGLGTAAVTVVAVLLAVFVAGGGRPGAPGPVSDTASKDGFVLELTVTQSSYAPNAPIDAHATLTYTGSQPISRVWGGGTLVLFSLVDVDGTRDVPGAMNLPCIPYPITPGKPQTFPFTKSGGYSPSDPNAEFIQAYLNDPQLRLPSGTWELEAHASFNTGDTCSADPISLSATVRITVGATSAASLQAEMTASPAPSPTLPPTTVAPVPTQPPAEATSAWLPVTMPSPVAHGPFGGPQGGVAALPGGGFIDFVVEAPDRVSIYRSADGAVWQRTGEIDGSGADGLSGPIAWNGTTYVALGSEAGGESYAAPFNGAAWTSPDLVHWTKAPAQDAFGGVTFSGIATGAGGFVAIGHSQGEVAVCWTSRDGLHWTAVTERAAFPEGSLASSVAWRSDHFLIVGSRSGSAAAWTSADGTHWSPVAGLPGSPATFLDGLADGPGGLVTLATGGPATEVAPDDLRSPVAPWTSRDGVAWTSHANSNALFGALASIAAAPGGYVAAGTLGLDQAGRIWTSTDGTTWVPVAGVELPAVSEIHLVSDGHRVLVFGRSAASGGWVAIVSDGVHA